MRFSIAETSYEIDDSHAMYYTMITSGVGVEGIIEIDTQDTSVSLSLRIAKALTLKIPIPCSTLRPRIDRVLNRYEIISRLKRDTSLMRDPYIHLATYYEKSITGGYDSPDIDIPYGLILLLAYTIMEHANPDVSWRIYTLKSTYQYTPSLYNGYTYETHNYNCTIPFCRQRGRVIHLHA